MYLHAFKVSVSCVVNWKESWVRSLWYCVRPSFLAVLFGSFSEIPECYVSIGHDWFISSFPRPLTELLTPLTLNQAAVRDQYPILTNSVNTILMLYSIFSVVQMDDLKLGTLPKRFIERPAKSCVQTFVISLTRQDISLVLCCESSVFHALLFHGGDSELRCDA